MTAWSLPDDKGTESALPPFGDLVAGLADIDEDDDAIAAARAGIMRIERITLALSVELEVAPAGTGELTVHGSTPTQWTETTVMPVFHRLTLHVGQDPNLDDHGEG